MKVKIKKFHKDAVLPKRATELAGGWDVVVTEIIKESDDFVICNLGFGLQPPDNYKITLVPRSSLTKTHWILQNSPGLGDADFVNEYSFRFRCIPFKIDSGFGNVRDSFIFEPFPYKVGDRIGQIYLEEVIPIEFEEVEELTKTQRTGGWGSTDK